MRYYFLKFCDFLFDHLGAGWFWPGRPLFWMLPYVGEYAFLCDYPDGLPEDDEADAGLLPF